ncbi:hypothetical protein [Verrucomicrobium spinosum]|uniref:hypothetical protein n=1 Tax=Verrucomicrobium spinosum TaxID=2736 RepID=UPI000A5439D8|nr:hypothetical protein [Verrucomicrobium spinosum]
MADCADFLEPTLRTVKVSAVPEYEFLVAGNGQRKRTLPCEEPVQLRLPCVVGRRESGLVCALLPTLDVQFELPGGDRIEEMALHYARQALKGQNRLPPALPAAHGLSAGGDRVLPVAEEGQRPRGAPEHLGKVAEHVGSPAIRRHVRTWEREADVARVQARLDLSKGSTLLVGGPGSGKTAVLVDAARKVERELGLGPGEARSQRFWISSGSRLIAGQRWLGQWQEQLEKVIAELRALDGVLCLESLQELLRLGGSSPGSSLAAFLVPYLQTGELRVVVEATPEEVESCERELPAFLDALASCAWSRSTRRSRPAFWTRPPARSPTRRSSTSPPMPRARPDGSVDGFSPMPDFLEPHSASCTRRSTGRARPRRPPWISPTCAGSSPPPPACPTGCWMRKPRWMPQLWRSGSTSASWPSPVPCSRSVAP